MRPPVKDHITCFNRQDDPGIDASDSPDNKDMARQEFLKETDANFLMSRYGVEPLRGTPMYGEWDDSIDLQTAFAAIADAQTAYARLPDALRAKFKRMEDVLEAVEKGTLVLKDGEPPVETPPAVPAAPPPA